MAFNVVGLRGVVSILKSKAGYRLVCALTCIVMSIPLWVFLAIHWLDLIAWLIHQGASEGTAVVVTFWVLPVMGPVFIGGFVQEGLRAIQARLPNLPSKQSWL